MARLATVDDRGAPQLVPIVFALAEQTIYSVVDAKPKRTAELRRLENVRSNPAVSVLVDHYDDSDWSALWWVRADGAGRVLDAAEREARHAVELLLDRYPQQRAIGAGAGGRRRSAGRTGPQPLWRAEAGAPSLRRARPRCRRWSGWASRPGRGEGGAACC